MKGAAPAASFTDDRRRSRPAGGRAAVAYAGAAKSATMREKIHREGALHVPLARLYG